MSQLNLKQIITKRQGISISDVQPLSCKSSSGAEFNRNVAYESIDIDQYDEAFAKDFTNLAVNEFNFKPYPELIHNWKVLAHILRRAMLRKNASAAFTMGAGEGKTTGTARFAATQIIGNDKSMMIITNLLSNGKEIVENINKWSGTNEALLVDGSMKDTDTTKVRVLVITHAMLKKTLYGKGRRGIDELTIFNDSPRDLVVVDEAIDLRKSHTITIQQLRHLDTTLELINKKKSVEIRKTISWYLKMILNVIDRAGVDIQKNHDIPNNLTLDFSSARKILKSKYGSTPDPAMGISWDTVIDNLEILITSEYFTVKTGSVTYISTASDYMPKNTSIVILDASSDIDEIYYQYRDAGLLDIVRTRNARSFMNATLYARQVGASKFEMLEKDGTPREDVISTIEAEVLNKTKPDDKILIITYKAVREKIELLPWKDRDVMFMSWGDITGRNDAKERTEVFIFGLPFKPRVDALNKMHAINGNTSDKHLEGKYRNTDIVADVYQAIMRSALRVPQNDYDCIKTNVYITIPNAMHGTSAQLRKMIGPILEKKINGAILKEWEIEKTGGILDNLFAEGTWFNTYRLPATRLSPTLKKIQQLLLNEVKVEKILVNSKYHGIIAITDMAKAISTRAECVKKVESTMRKTLNRAGVNQLSLLTGWTFNRFEVFNQKTRRNIKMYGFKAVME